ncbi:MAG: XRE family transcriptional regulator [Microbacteriaceae bacterium]|nr:XRE family transcriptional regulator [Microbacteriaceae bacterium]
MPVVSPADAPHVVRAARTDAGLSQRALADRAGLKQANIAEIELGRRSVSAELLSRLLSAADYRPAIPTEQHAEEIKQIGRELGLSNVRVFGSVARGEDHFDSDLDLLVDLDPGASTIDAFAFPSFVEDLIGFPVDMVIDEGESPYLARIRAEAIPL